MFILRHCDIWKMLIQTFNGLDFHPQVTRSKRGRAIYSPLHKFVNRELRAAEEAENKPPEYDIVSDAAVKKTSSKPLKKKSGECNYVIPGIRSLVLASTKAS